MSGVEIDPEALSDSEKLTRILAQITTMNMRLDSHGQRLALMEKSGTGASGVPAAALGGASGAGGDLDGNDGGGPAQGVAHHNDNTSAPSGSGTVKVHLVPHVGFGGLMTNN
jgi:hypothetical protein